MASYFQSFFILVLISLFAMSFSKLFEYEYIDSRFSSLSNESPTIQLFFGSPCTNETRSIKNLNTNVWIINNTFIECSNNRTRNAVSTSSLQKYTTPHMAPHSSKHLKIVSSIIFVEFFIAWLYMTIIVTMEVFLVYNILNNFFSYFSTQKYFFLLQILLFLILFILNIVYMFYISLILIPVVVLILILFHSHTQVFRMKTKSVNATESDPVVFVTRDNNNVQTWKLPLQLQT